MSTEGGGAAPGLPAGAAPQHPRVGPGWARRTWRAVRWYVGALLGDADHDRYVAHLARTQPGAVPLGVGEYWRERHAHAGRHPGSRCC